MLAGTGAEEVDATAPGAEVAALLTSDMLFGDAMATKQPLQQASESGIPFDFAKRRMRMLISRRVARPQIDFHRQGKLQERYSNSASLENAKDVLIPQFVWPSISVCPSAPAGGRRRQVGAATHVVLSELAAWLHATGCNAAGSASRCCGKA